MKRKKQFAACLAAAMGLLAFSACSRNGQTPRLANELSFSLEGISEITISYDEEEVTFYENEGDELRIKEYMTVNKSSYYAKVKQSGSGIKISEGGKPLFKDGFLRYIEVYLPASYHENLTITTTNGDIDISEAALSLNYLRVDSTSGTVRLKDAKASSIHLSSTSGTLELGSLDADAIRIDTTKGNVACERLDGNVTYTTTSGNADIESAAGSGSFKANNSGDLEVVYTEVSGDLSFYNKNGDVCVTLPAELEFEFEATTKNGSISTNFQEAVSVEGRKAVGTVGEYPAVTVKVETKNGKIEVEQ